MAQFKDKNGEEWQINIDARKIQRIRADCDKNFLLNDSAQDSTYRRMQDDEVILCVVIYLLCEKQRESRATSDADFYANLDGDAIDNATEALLETILNFTRKKKRKVMKAVVEKSDSLEDKAMELAMAKINDPKLEEELLEKLKDRIDADVQKVLTELENVTDTPDS